MQRRLIRPTYCATTPPTRAAWTASCPAARRGAFLRPGSPCRHAALKQNGQNPGAKRTAARALGGLNTARPMPRYPEGKRRPKTRARHALGVIVFLGPFARPDVRAAFWEGQLERPFVSTGHALINRRHTREPVNLYDASTHGSARVEHAETRRTVITARKGHLRRVVAFNDAVR